MAIGSLIASFELDTSKFERSYQKIDRRFQRMQKSVFSLKGAFAALGGSMAARNLVRTAVELDRVNNTLKFATGGAKEAAEAMNFLRAESNRLGQDVLQQAGAFAKLSAAARGTKVEGDQVREIFLGISEAATVLGMSAEQAQGALTAIEQMISKGKVSAEELRGQLGERLPGAFQIAARSIGVTTAELDKMLSTGKLTADQLLPKFAAELRKTFGPDVADAANSTQAKINRLNNEILDLKTNLIDSGLVDGVLGFAKALAFVGEKSVEAAKGTGIITAQLAAFIGEGDGFHDNMMRLFAAPFVNLANIINGTVGMLPDATSKIRKQIADTEQEIAALEFASERYGSNPKMRESLKELNARLAMLKAQLVQVNNEMPTRQTSSPAGSNDDAVAVIDMTNVKYASLADTLGLVETRMQDQAHLFRAAADANREAMTPLERYNAEIEKLTGLKEFGLTEEAFNRLKEKAHDAFLGDNSISEFAKQAGRNMQSALAQFFYDMDFNMDNMLKSFVDMMRQMIAQMLAFQTLQAVGTAFPMFGSFFGVGAPAPGRALGGPVSSGKPYMVGEEGRELFVPNQAGTIIPNKELGGGSGKTTIIINNDNRGAVSLAEVDRISRMRAAEAAAQVLGVLQGRPVSANAFA